MTRTIMAVGVSTLALAFGATSALATGVPTGPSASQSNATTQVIPVAVSAPITAPVNASVPIAVAGSNGDTDQSNRTAVDGSATNNDTEQVVVQGSKSGSAGSASQSNATTQVIPVAVSAPITAPVNASVPIAVAGSNGDTDQSNRTAVDGSATNNDTEQVVVQGSKSGSAGSASQSNATTQVIPVAVSAPITAPVNASVPIAVAGSNGDTDQSNRTAVDGSATNNDTEQVVVQGAGHPAKGSEKDSPTRHDSAKDCHEPEARQSNATAVNGAATNNHTGQRIVQRAGGSAVQSNATTQVLPVALALPVTVPVNLSVPVAIGLPALPPLPVVGGLTSVVGAVLADPLGTVQGTLADPLGALLGTVGALGLPLPALPV